MTGPREVTCFFLGCAFGVGAALVFAPTSRKRTMKYLRNKADDGVECAKKGVDQARHAVDTASERAKTAIDRVGEGLDTAKKLVHSVNW
jgi:gas vesicle protein